MGANTSTADAVGRDPASNGDELRSPPRGPRDEGRLVRSLIILLAALLMLGGAQIASGCQERSDIYEIVWTGDILLADAAQPYLDEYGYTWPFEHVQPLLEGDFVIGNAEGPITERSQPYFERQRWSYNAEPEAAQALAVSEEWSTGAVAGPGQPGTVPFGGGTIARGKELAEAAGARWTIAYVHWGENYSTVTSKQRRLAASFAQAGYDLVIGHHPHVQQEVELIDGMPVIYSLGNFTFGSEGRFTEEFPGYGLVARTLLGEEGFAGIELACILTDNDFVEYQPQPCDEEQARAVMEGLGPLVVWQDGIGLVEW